MSDQPTWQDGMMDLARLLSPEEFFHHLDTMPAVQELPGDDQVGFMYMTFLFLGTIKPTLFLAAITPGDRLAALQVAADQMVAHLFAASSTASSAQGSPRNSIRKDRTASRQPDRWRQYAEFLDRGGSLLHEQIQTVAAILTAWVRAEDDPSTDPNQLIATAADLAEPDLKQIRRLLARAAALVLTGQRWYWRWPEELSPPLAGEVRHFMLTVDLLTAGRDQPFATPDEEWQQWLAIDTEAELGQAEDGMGSSDADDDQEGDGDEIEAEEALEALIDELFGGADALTPEVIAEFQDLDLDPIPDLLELAADEELLAEDAEGEGWAPIHAVRLLGLLHAVEAIPVLVDILAEQHSWSPIHRQAALAVEDIGQAALPMLLDFLHYSPDTSTRLDVAQAVAKLGRSLPPGDQRREAVFREIAQLYQDATWPHRRILAAQALVALQDEQAIPLLKAGLSDPEISTADIQRLATGLRQFGVEVDPSLIEQLQESRSKAEYFTQSLFPLSQILGPQWFAQFAAHVPEDLRAQLEPEALAHIFTSTAELTVALRLAQAVVSTGPELGPAVANELLEELDLEQLVVSDEELAAVLPDEFDRQTYDHVLTCAIDEFISRLQGIATAFSYYALEPNSQSLDPNAIIAEAQHRLEQGDEETALEFVGQAGALALMGEKAWPLWKDEVQPPLRLWLEGIERLIEQLKHHQRWPLAPIAIEYQRESVKRQQDPAAVPSLFQAEPVALPPIEESAAIVPLLDALFLGERAINRKVIQRFQKHRQDTIPALIRILADRRLWSVDEEGEGWAPVHAARLLGELRADSAVDELLAALVHTTQDDLLRDTILKSLRQIGPPAISALIEFLRWSTRTAIQSQIAQVLAEVGRGDERVYQTLGEFFQDSDWESTRGAAAVALGILQDPRAVPLLRQALQNESLDEYDVSQVISALNLLGVDITQDREARQAMSRVAMAKRQTGGLRIVEDEEGEAHKLRYDAQGRPMCPDCGGPMEYEDGEWVHAPPEVVRVQPTARPNDPCPCGSGKKYKHCCMRKDLGRYETDRG